MRYLRLALLCVAAVGLVLYGCSREAPTDAPDPATTYVPGAPMFTIAAPNTETLGDIDIALPDATGMVAAGVGMRGDPGVTQPGVININVPGTPVMALLYWEGQMETQVNGDADLTVKLNGGAATPVSGTFIGGEPTKIAPIGDEWTTSFRADITGLAGWTSGANTVEVSDMDFDSRCSDCRNDGATVIVLYDDGGDAGTVDIKDGNDLAFRDFLAPYDATVPQTFNFPADPDDARTATLVIATGSVSNPNRPNIICVSIDGGPPVEHYDLMGVLGGLGHDDWDTVTLTPNIPAGATSLTVELKSAQGAGSIWPAGSLPASMVWVAGGLYVPPADQPPLGCRVTGGLVDESSNCFRCPSGSSGNNVFTAGGQAGANTALPPQPKGEWTHHQKRGPAGTFVFHGGTASAPEFTEIDWIECMDPDNCNPAREAPAKQIDFGGVGTFKNLKKNGPDIIANNVEVGVSLHYFEVNIDDLGEPGKGGKQDPPTAMCPAEGFGVNSPVELADCDCPDFYRITIWAGPTSASEVIYEASGYIKGGNFQIHPLTGYDGGPDILFE
jgi:hypothetical protein